VLREVVLDQLGRQAPAALDALAPAVMIEALARRFPAPADDADCPQRAAAYVDGDELITWCEDDTSRFCAGYLAGLVDYQDELRHLDVATPRFCLPEDTTLSQIHRLALDRLRANPRRERQKLAASLVIPAFIRRFPCR